MMVKLVTDLGDAAFLLPASIIVACHLLIVRSRAAALIWLSTLALCVALTLLAKIASLACGHQFPSLAIHSPSGHTSLSTTFYLCGALMLSARRPPLAQIALAIAGIGLVGAIAASRLWLHAHTPSEVALGMAIGLVCVGWFAALYQRSAAPEALPWSWLLVLTIVLAVAMHGRHLGVETRLTQLIARIQHADFGYAKICLPDKEWAAAAARPGPLAPSEPDSGSASPATGR
jgi:membrane-associated phospholipid phosphatase